MRTLNRRAALMGAAGLLAACDTVRDAADYVLEDRKVPLAGERRAVLTEDKPLTVDEGANAAVTLPAPTPRADWLQVGGGLSHAPGNPVLGAQLGEAWRTSVGAGSTYRRRMVAQPVSDGRTIYVADAEGEVSAVDVATGRRGWRFDTTPKEDSDGQLGGGLALADGVLYATTGLAEAMALDPTNGSVKWRVRLPAPARGAPTVAGGRIFVPTIDNHVHALKTADGEKIWSYRGQTIAAMALGLPAPAVEGDTVVLGLASGEVAAVRATDGRALWTEALGSARGTSLAEISGVSGLPVIDRGRVFITAQGGSTVALDLRSGRRLWERDVPSPETPWVVGDWVFVRTNNMELVCFGRNDGRIRWVRALPRWRDEARRRDPIVWSGPIVAGGRIFITGNNAEMLELAAANGEPISRLRLSAPTLLAPMVFNSTLFLLTEDATLVAVRGI